MRESTLWAAVKRNWGGVQGLRMMRVENACGVGTPDVCLGYRGRCYWVELKQLREGFPVRPTTSVRITHFTGEQRGWIKEWGTHAGVPVFLLVQVVGEGYYLFDHMAAQLVHERPRGWWEEHAAHFMPERSGRWLGLLSAIIVK